MPIPGYSDLGVRTAHFTFEYLDTVVDRSTATDLANVLSANAEADFAIVNAWFDGLMPGDAQFTVALGISQPGSVAWQPPTQVT
jgi:hypothetical protein